MNVAQPTNIRRAKQSASLARGVERLWAPVVFNVGGQLVSRAEAKLDRDKTICMSQLGHTCTWNSMAMRQPFRAGNTSLMSISSVVSVGKPEQSNIK